MNLSEYFSLLSLLVDLIKIIIPYLFFLFIFLRLQGEIKAVLSRGGWKLSGPGGLSIEQQFLVKDSNSQKKVEDINKELKGSQEKSLEEKNASLENEKRKFFMWYHFEKTYRIIFASQIELLERVNNEGSVSLHEAELSYSKTIWSKLSNSDFNRYIGFLKYSGLLEDKDKNTLKITPVGILFLKYIHNNKLLKKDNDLYY